MVKQNGGVFLDDATSLYSGLCLHLQYRGKMLSHEAAYSPRPVEHANCTKKSPPPTRIQNHCAPQLLVSEGLSLVKVMTYQEV